MEYRGWRTEVRVASGLLVILGVLALLSFAGVPLGRPFRRGFRSFGAVWGGVVLLGLGVLIGVGHIVRRAIDGPEQISVLLLTDGRLLWVTAEATWSLSRTHAATVGLSREHGQYRLTVEGDWIGPGGDSAPSMSFPLAEDEEAFGISVQQAFGV